MQKLDLRLPLKKSKNFWLVTGLAVLVILMAIIGIIKAVAPPMTEQAYYVKQLGTLKQQVTKIRSLEQEQRQTVILQNTGPYKDALTNSVGLCRQLDARYEKDKTNLQLKSILGQINKVRLFCKDYETVSVYAYKLASATEPLLNYPTTSGISSDLSGQQPTGLTDTLSNTLADLDKLKSDPIQDPAISEIIAYVNIIQKQAGSNNPQALQNTLRTQQLNVINARRYYWENTIGIAAIEHSLDKLQSQFKNSSSQLL